MPRTSAAGLLGIDEGTPVRLRRLADDAPAEGIDTPIHLGRRS
jgi:hypothetical protein